MGLFDFLKPRSASTTNPSQYIRKPTVQHTPAPYGGFSNNSAAGGFSRGTYNFNQSRNSTQQGYAGFDGRGMFIGGNTPSLLGNLPKGNETSYRAYEDTVRKNQMRDSSGNYIGSTMLNIYKPPGYDQWKAQQGGYSPNQTNQSTGYYPINQTNQSTGSYPNQSSPINQSTGSYQQPVNQSNPAPPTGDARYNQEYYDNINRQTAALGQTQESYLGTTPATGGNGSSGGSGGSTGGAGTGGGAGVPAVNTSDEFFTDAAGNVTANPNFDPAMQGIGNQGTLGPGAPGSTSTDPQRRFDIETGDTISSEDITQAFDNPASAPGFFGEMFENIQEGQQGVTSARDRAQLTTDSLTEARRMEGYTDAIDQVRDVNKRVSEFNVMLQGLENDVREDLGPEVTESFIQAELRRRTTDLEPEAQRLGGEQANALSNLNLIKEGTTQRFNSMRQDVSDSIFQVQEQLGFSEANINTAMNLLTNMKQFELLSDAQADGKRDAARTTVALLMSSPRGLSAVGDADLAQLEIAAQMPPGTLKDIRDNIGTNMEALFQNVDDAGSLNMLLFDPATGTYQTKHFPDFATIIASSTGGLTAAQLKLFENTSDAFKAEYNRQSLVMKAVIGATDAEAKAQGFANAADYRRQALQAASASLGGLVDNEASRLASLQFRQTYEGTSEFTGQKETAEFDAFAAQLPEGI